MKYIIVAITFQILFMLIIDLLYVKFDLFKFGNIDDILYWIVNVMVALPLYVKGYLALYQTKWLVIILSMISFIVFGILSAILMLFFHTEVLNAPL